MYYIFRKIRKNYDALNTLQLISGKWKILIMKSIAKSCPKRFGELRKDMDSMSQGTLTTQLRELEENGLICRKIYAEVPPKVEYKLSNLGITLLPIISELENWWQDYSLCIKTSRKTTSIYKNPSLQKVFYSFINSYIII